MQKAGRALGLTLQTSASARDRLGGGEMGSGGWRAPGAAGGGGGERRIKAEPALA